ncbi:DUF4240 domain-containing protein [Leptotrichia sp. OH3620_COT-345]|uniref:DUF4240 domain-containing protein n=1 Tax=Leptotrichia sp. OH3620_COT-345 TaxID=2491048 RepID=UPI000F64777A|nr:DUF4240 domain-containing protein [Leptotrichia sp. OH3620_COT-345]RRD40404.1 DUF4240 domain-containing protein [Leptotrichia sp. OH3620_COT-345]
MELKMTRKDFWKYIDDAVKKHQDGFEAMTYLADMLTDKTNEEIFSFGIIVDEIMLESYNEKLWCASYLVNGDTGEDCFDFFRLWLISRGERIYNDVVKNPDNLIKYIENSVDEKFVQDFYENEDFFFIAVDAFGKKNKIEMFEEVFEKYLDEFDNYKYKIGYVDVDYPKLKFTWCEKVPKSMRKICPKLFERLYIGEN